MSLNLLIAHFCLLNWRQLSASAQPSHIPNFSTISIPISILLSLPLKISSHYISHFPFKVVSKFPPEIHWNFHYRVQQRLNSIFIPNSIKDSVSVSILFSSQLRWFIPVYGIDPMSDSVPDIDFHRRSSIPIQITFWFLIPSQALQKTQFSQS